jgi:hypothetical protein
VTTPFLIGIDLGTTNSAVAFVDTIDAEGRVQLFAIPQLTEPSVVDARTFLPSFLYFPEPHEVESGAVALPWTREPESIAGVLARDRGALVPGRQVASAKSWLAHAGVDRRAPILPVTDPPNPRISPIDASARYLIHMRDAWNQTMAAADDRRRLERQRIVLTVPASFDEEARELTVEAAQAAGFEHLTLIEEPIAAFYAWMAEDRDQAARAEERLALVCDVGGGTTDFSLIRVHHDAGAPAFERLAIGEHLLLGGDNVDLALAVLLERRIAQARPDARLAITQRAALRRSCAAAKERMLGDDPPDRVSVSVLGAGRSVIGGATTVDLTRQDVEATLGDFLPITPPGDIATPRDRRTGLRELGLPYETDPAITRHLAAFLSRAAATIADDRVITTVAGRSTVHPDLVLFNGGFFTPAVARDRVVGAMEGWFGEPPQVLTTHNLEAAVAIGAATYARLRAGVGRPLSLVRAGSARAYYLALRAHASGEGTGAVCVLARGTDEGTSMRLDQPFTLATNRPIACSLFSSMVRADRAGDLVTLGHDDEVHEHAPLVTVLRYGRKSRQIELPVRLAVAFTEVGTLELWCESQVSDHRWRLQFQLRGAEGAALSMAPAAAPSAPDAHESVVADETVVACEGIIRSVFEGSGGEATAQTLMAVLEQTTGYGKVAWPLGVLRRFADVLIEVAAGRRRSPDLEARWLNLFGFCVRPGFGAAKDPWRIGEARKVYVAGPAFPSVIQNRVEWLVLWQRTAGGFSTGQQRDLAQRGMGDLGLGGKKASRLNAQVERETWRLLAMLERLDAATRVRIGDALLLRLRRDADNVSLLWAIGRLGARTPLYGPLTSVVGPHDAARWVEALVALDRVTPDLAGAIVQIGAITGDPLRDIAEDVRARARQHLEAAGVAGDALRALDEVVHASVADANRVFGEPLPDGLRLDDQPQT